MLPVSIEVLPVPALPRRAATGAWGTGSGDVGGRDGVP